ncbi:hypothetical protein GWK47_015292 [Chionoecetes opilio]|uniref:Uncharacterized protein n=1 Tax=Chionoecetes opilio TaxID=41210 RepID=A0A8J4XSI0_CHIOP|nr:hypothetical protein GWK47_015292 [Chionoecetes opilio]
MGHVLLLNTGQHGDGDLKSGIDEASVMVPDVMVARLLQGCRRMSGWLTGGMCSLCCIGGPPYHETVEATDGQASYLPQGPYLRDLYELRELPLGFDCSYKSCLVGDPT